MKTILFIMLFAFISCDKSEATKSTKAQSSAQSKFSAEDELFAKKSKDEGCELDKEQKDKFDIGPNETKKISAQESKTMIKLQGGDAGCDTNQ